MLRIVTDGGADMPAGWEMKYDINVLPLSVRFGEKVYMQGKNLTAEKFYELVRTHKMVPNTSLPSPAQVVEFYRKLADKGDQILSIHVASKMSGTFNIIQMAARELMGELDVIPFDSEAGSAALGLMCREARLIDRAGGSLQDILTRLDAIRQRLTIVFTVDNLDFARMSGRVNALQSTISSVLKIKPIIKLRDGLLMAGEKVRTRQKALDHILEDVKERVNQHRVVLAVVHAADPLTAQALVERARSMFNVAEMVISDLSIPVAAHLGPGTIGIVAIPTGDDEGMEDGGI